MASQPTTSMPSSCNEEGTPESRVAKHVSTVEDDDEEAILMSDCSEQDEHAEEEDETDDHDEDDQEQDHEDEEEEEEGDKPDALTLGHNRNSSSNSSSKAPSVADCTKRCYSRKPRVGNYRASAVPQRNGITDANVNAASDTDSDDDELTDVRYSAAANYIRRRLAKAALVRSRQAFTGLSALECCYDYMPWEARV